MNKNLGLCLMGISALVTFYIFVVFFLSQGGTIIFGAIIPYVVGKWIYSQESDDAVIANLKKKSDSITNYLKGIVAKLK